MAQRGDRFPMFDSLRAVAALCIVAYHALFQASTFAGAGEGWWRYGRNLDVGVPIFFGISGFLLYRPFVAARLAGRPRPSLKRYGARRVLRIVPAFWVALTVFAIWFGRDETSSLGGIVTYYGFLQVYDPDTAIGMVGQAWSIDVEATFYLSLPLWVLLAQRIRPALRSELLALAAIWVAALSWKVFAVSQAEPADPRDLVWFLTLPNFVDFIAIGMALAVVSAHGTPGRLLTRHRLLWPAGVALFLIAAWLFAQPHDQPATDTSHLARQLLFSGIVLCALAPAVFGSARPTRVLTWIGTVSYSLFLLHVAVYFQLLEWWGDFPHGTGQWIVWTVEVLAASLALAAISYHLVERPFIALGRFRRSAQAHAAP